MLGLAAGAALLAILADRPSHYPPPRRRPIPPHIYHGDYVGPPPGSAVYRLPGGLSPYLTDGYVWLAAGERRSLDLAIELAHQAMARGHMTEVFDTDRGVYVVVIGAMQSYRATTELYQLVNRDMLPPRGAFTTDGRRFTERIWASPDVLREERAAGW